ncbi:DNA-directed RNA polymerase II subunit RPB4 [Gregarina niphandrodes]|uniref:DNA-directed RNA polymerase II subunit RPB4 n=1 Tax=Gregarina niphandrodes TaxID=110365 RepID=A0A023B7I3_GRENI|nr:DNA-directed RNA polymerase II subunit RPB4 [Gregarina niphandrodes]EZG67405.1 DNA-directed RNA polymerase II subunit RPB4 [Gregarina niphandrodes]|eukprot:XP_011130238.1 DNA-directed RNA polymerase II subunit RPB4 [Gregarina niphandrodes]
MLMYLASLELEVARCLNLCELELILADQMKINSRRDPQAQAIMKASFDYAHKFGQIKNREAVVQLRNQLEASKANFTEFEMASIVNLMPATAEEAKALIPSLTRLSDEILSKVLADMARFHLFAM